MRKLAAILTFLALASLCSCAFDPSVARYKKPKFHVYVVTRGDTLSEISKKFDIPVADIKRQNRITSSKISVGQRLFIPTESGSVSPGYSSKNYKSGKGGYKAKNSGIRGKRKKRLAALPPAKAPKIGIKLNWPVKKPVITSRFGVRQSGKHDGLDIGAPKGTKIYAAASGKVLFSGWGPTGYGNVVILKHNEKVFTVYSHNQKNLVKKGERVKSGQPIATVGKTGRARGPHLHFEVRVSRVAYDPMAYLPDKR